MSEHTSVSDLSVSPCVMGSDRPGPLCRHLWLRGQVSPDVQALDTQQDLAMPLLLAVKKAGCGGSGQARGPCAPLRPRSQDPLLLGILPVASLPTTPSLAIPGASALTCRSPSAQVLRDCERCLLGWMLDADSGRPSAPPLSGVFRQRPAHLLAPSGLGAQGL